MGRFPNKNKNKKKNRNGGAGPSQSNRKPESKMPGGVMPELYDLEHGPLPDIGDDSVPSMRSMSARPGRNAGRRSYGGAGGQGGRPHHSLMEEVGYTAKNVERTVREPLRNKPIEFVKAKEVYDPNKKLREQEPKKTSSEVGIPKEHQDLLDCLELTSLEEERPTRPRIEISSDEEEGGDEVEEEEEENELQVDVAQAEVVDATVNEEDSEVQDIEVSADDAEEEWQTEEESEGDNENEILTLSSPEVVDAMDANIIEFSKEQSIEEDEELDLHSDEFVIDNEGDSSLSSNMKPFTSLVVDSSASRSQAVPSSTPGVEFNPVLTIGKVSLQTSKSKSGTTAHLMSVPRKASGFVDEHEDSDYLMESESDNDRAAYKDYISQVMNAMLDESDYESETNFDVMAESSEESEEEDVDDDDIDEEEPEYGFLSEDFEFDISQLSISNVRFGTATQYYTKCLELTGSISDSMWVDEDELYEFVLLKGVKEHRLQSFMKLMTKGLIDEEPFEVPNYSDVYISETSEEEEDEEKEDNSLEDLIAFRKANKVTYDFAPQSTSSVRTKGKGKNKHLDLSGLELTTDMHQALQDLYQNHREAKKNKKLKREGEKFQKGVSKHDLFVLYPFSIHVKEIREEFDTFLHDTSRDTMSFPPLDPHGNKTINKIAGFFNMKATRCGAGLHTYMKVSKSRKTFHYLPRYDQIGSVLRQRPIFNRTDQKRPKSEIIATDGNAKKDRERQRNKGKTASVQEGDIVGSKAPEIGVNNIGRQLLEKLGWVKGEGLGIHGKKGISEPVVAVVKNTKLGIRTSSTVTN